MSSIDWEKRYIALAGQLAAIVARAERAEERYKALTDTAREQAAFIEQLRTAQHRTLTPWAPITDEMVRRALDCNGKTHVEVNSLAGRAMRLALTAALTPPPPRPEGAEDLKHPVIVALAGMDSTRVHGLTQEDIEGLCDRLAERGVRVAGDAS